MTKSIKTLDFFSNEYKVEMDQHFCSFDEMDVLYHFEEAQNIAAMRLNTNVNWKRHLEWLNALFTI